MSSLVVNQVFRAWQGEGPSAGRRCAFIRLMGCNLTCDWSQAGGTLCDEAQTWNSDLYDLRVQGTRREAAEVAVEAANLGRGMVVITGGEPLLHQSQDGWSELLLGLRRHRQRIEVETNGTIQPAEYGSFVDQWNVSPKLASSGVERGKRYKPDVLRWFAQDRRAAFKFVCLSVRDVVTAANIAGEVHIPAHRVWIMPEGISREVLLQRAEELAPQVMSFGFNLTLRQHHLIYGEKGEPR